MRFQPGRRRRAQSHGKSVERGGRGRTTTLEAALESLERRSMLAANVLDVTKVLWNGKQVDAVRNEYVLRMPQTNAATAKSPIDYACRTPVAQAGWTVQSLGTGFFKVTAPGATQAALTTWATKQGARYIEANAVGRYFATPNDTLYGDTANWAFPKISADKAWDTGTGTSSTIVAVMDSGVDYTHEDLAGNMWRNPNEIAGDGIDNDRNGYIDDIFGINSDTRSGDPMDQFGHGTFCAGLIGAVGNNAKGIAGVNWSVKIMAVSIGNAAPSATAAIVAANYIAAQKAAGQNIASVNCSFGVGYSKAMEDAFRLMGNTGIVIAAAAGNESSDNDLDPRWPANFEIPEVISVAASTRADVLADFSNFGARTVDLAAPGENVLSTLLAGGQVGTELPANAAYGVSSGTSFAAPLVAGTAALLKSLKPGASASQVKAAILNGVDKVAALDGLVLTGGRLNLANSVNLIVSTTGSYPIPKFVDGQSLSFLEGNQGYTLAEIKVELDRPCDPGKSCSVYYTTQPGGSAFANVDYVATSGYLTFSGAETRKSFFVKIIGDRAAEQAEQFAVQLVAAKSRGIDPNTASVQQVNPIVLDDDYDTVPVQPGPTTPGLLPKVSVDVKRDAALNKLPIYEGSLATFVVSLDRTSTQTVSVKYRTNQPSLVPVNTALQGVDYAATSGTLTFKPGERTKEFTVRILADKVANEGIDNNGDGDVRDTGEGETFRVVLSEPLNAEFDTAAGGGGATTVNTSSAVTAEIIDAYVPSPSPGFQITLNYLGNVPTAVRGAAEWAAARWSQVITGDLPSVVDPETGTVIDDILIDVQMGLLGGDTTDGAGGTLANAGPEEFRTTGTLLPWKAVSGFDPADANNPLLKQIVLHEFGHALGFVGDLFDSKNLVNAASTGWIGANALREYRSIFQVPNALNVPLDTTGGAGTAGSHWNEDIFANELMTGYVNGATSLPLSRITLGAMQDLGYTVNYVKADPYTKASAAAAAAAAAAAMGVRNGSGGNGVRLALRDAVPPACVTVQPTAATAVVASSTSAGSTAAAFRSLAKSVRQVSSAAAASPGAGLRSAFALLTRS